VPGLRRLAVRGVVVLLLDWGALLVLGALLPDFDVHGAAGACVTAVIAAVLNALVWPTLSRLAVPLSVLHDAYRDDAPVTAAGGAGSPPASR
jgi:uncharacterized membrane protein YvlD (DUF360 family)